MCERGAGESPLALKTTRHAVARAGCCTCGNSSNNERGAPAPEKKQNPNIYFFCVINMNKLALFTSLGVGFKVFTFALAAAAGRRGARASAFYGQNGRWVDSGRLGEGGGVGVGRDFPPHPLPLTDFTATRVQVPVVK